MTALPRPRGHYVFDIFMLLGEVVEHRRTADLFLNPENEKTAEYVEERYA